MTTTDSAAHLGPADAERLRHEAEVAYQQCAMLGTEGDRLMAQSEIVIKAAVAGRELADGQDQLDAAKKRLAGAMAALEPAAEQLALVNATLAGLNTAPDDEADDDIDSVPVEERIAARVHLAALEQERARLERIAAKRQQAVRLAHEDIRSVERDLMPDLARAFDAANAALADPPLNDFQALLAAGAVGTMDRRAARIGISLLLALDPGENPLHKTHVSSILTRTLAYCGLLQEIRDGWKRELLGKLDLPTCNKVMVALGDIPDPMIVPMDHNQLAAQHRFDAQTIHGKQAVALPGTRQGFPGADDLPPTGSPEAQRQIAQGNRRQRDYERAQQRDRLW